jgi:hypothetical protein
MNHHLDEQQLNDCADNALGAAGFAAAEAHLRVCAACRERLDALRILKAQLASLPRDIAPPAHVLAGVHARIAEAPMTTATPMTAAAGASAQAISAPAGTAAAATWRVRPRLLAAAAVMLIAVSSAITVLLLRPSPDGSVPAITRDAVAPGATRLVRSSALEDTYEDAIAELERAFERQQDMLAPDTRRVLEHNLAIIDRALAESRAALAADPANAALADVIRSGYERKLDVLRSATTQARARS